LALSPGVFPQDSLSLRHVKTIHGNITPKSIIYAGNGFFFAQGMMYTHKITVYDRNYRLVKSIDDKVQLKELGHPEYKGSYQGAPVEAAASNHGKYVWVTNYRMSGNGFYHPGFDECGTAGGFDSSFIYRIDTEKFQIDAAVKVGSVPKYIAVTPDNRMVLVTNWCSGDLSVIDISKMREVRRVPLGLYPRGIVVDSKSQIAYVAIMGSDKIAKINLKDFSVMMIENIGKRPRHLCITDEDNYLFASLNGEDRVVKIDMKTERVVASVSTGDAPRSMALSKDGKLLYVVNYKSGTLSVISVTDMMEIQKLNTDLHPIGVAHDPETGDVWVACYSGSIQIFKNASNKTPESLQAKSNHKEITLQNFQYHIIIGAFREEHNLNKMILRCWKAGYHPYILNPESEIKKLSCKGFDDKASALAELRRVKDIFGESAWIMKQPMLTDASK